MNVVDTGLPEGADGPLDRPLQGRGAGQSPPQLIADDAEVFFERGRAGDLGQDVLGGREIGKVGPTGGRSDDQTGGDNENGMP